MTANGWRRGRDGNAGVAALLLAVVVSLSGCGSTVASGSAGGAPGEMTGLDVGDGVGGPVADPGGAGSATAPTETADFATGGVAGTGPGGGLSGAATGGTPATGPGTSADGSSGGGTGAAGPSVAAGSGPVQIGFAVTKNNASTASSLGFSGIDNGNEKGVVQALVAAANSSGGLAGRRIAPVFFELDPTTTESSDEFGQRQCAAFTEDAKVMAVSSNAIVPTLASCLAKRGILGLSGSPQQAFSEAELRALPTIATFGLTQRLQAAAIVEAAASQGYLEDRPRVGIVTVDSTRFRDAAAKAMLPALRGKGARIDAEDVFYGPEIKRTSDLSALATAMQSAVLRMRSRGVSHVVFLQDAAAPALVFMQQADSQNATFRYALSSPDAPQVLVDNGIPPRQLRGAVAAGWDAYLDVPVTKAGPAPPGRKWCNQVFSKLGLARGSNAEWIAFMHCDAFRLLLAAGNKASGGVSTSSLVAGLGRVGTLDSANIPSARISAGHRWATSGYRLNRYDEACGCFSYLSTTVRPI